jgi:glutaminase
MKTTLVRRRPGRTDRLVAETSDRVPGAAARGGFEVALGGAPLFQGMSSHDVAAALAEFDECHFPGGSRIVLEGLRGSDFFIIAGGSAAVLVDGWRVATLAAGDFFGEIAVLGSGLRSASVRAETPLHCLVLPNGKLEALLLVHPRLGLNLIRIVIGRYQDVAGRRQPPARELAGA